MFGTLIAPGTSGSNGVLIAGMPVIDSAPIVVPWYAIDRLITLYSIGLPVSLKYCRASFHALSTASPPPVVKNTRFEVAGREAREPLGQLDRRRVRVGPQREVRELAGLFGRGLRQRLAAVADLHHEQTRRARRGMRLPCWS